MMGLPDRNPLDGRDVASLRVLLVDDNAEFRRGLRAMLAASSLLAVAGEAENGEAALALIRTLRPDVVLMDVAMPGMNGLEATELIKAMPEPPHVVVVSLYDLPAYRAAALTAGADGFLAKADITEDVAADVLRACGVAERPRT